MFFTSIAHKCRSTTTRIRPLLKQVRIARKFTFDAFERNFRKLCLHDQYTLWTYYFAWIICGHESLIRYAYKCSRPRLVVSFSMLRKKHNCASRKGTWTKQFVHYTKETCIWMQVSLVFLCEPTRI